MSVVQCKKCGEHSMADAHTNPKNKAFHVFETTFGIANQDRRKMPEWLETKVKSILKSDRVLATDFICQVESGRLSCDYDTFRVFSVGHICGFSAGLQFRNLDQSTTKE